MNASFDEIFEKYLAEKKVYLREGSIESLVKLNKKISLFQKRKGKLFLTDISLNWAKDFARKLTNGSLGKCTNRTIKLYGVLLTGFLDKAQLEGYQVNNDLKRIKDYFQNIKVPKNVKPIIHKEELALLWNYDGYHSWTNTFHQVTPFQKKGVDFFVYQTQVGCRWSDISRVTRGDIKEKNGKYYLVNFQTKKTGHEIHVHLNDLALEVVKRYRPNFLNLSKSTLIFIKDLVPSCSNATGNLKKIAKRTGLDREVRVVRGKLEKIKREFVPFYEAIATHMARRTFATEWIEEGKSMYILSKILGHKSINTTETYISEIINLIPEGIDNDLSLEYRELFKLTG